jgi:NAD(P)-dependent dehydrogenase (short-subunit alcohol dehydrogenase family)
MMKTSNAKVWFITGAGRGFGRIWATAALQRGDKVAATARDTASLDALVQQFGDAVLPIKLDVTDRAAVFASIAEARDAFGRLDVVLSNAGYGHQGAVEEITEAEARAQFDTNFFGTMWMAQAAMPLFRQQKFGHLVAVSSVLGVCAIPLFGLYSASKFAVEGLLDSLSQEAAAHGVRVTLVEPAGYATDFNNPSSSRQSATNPAYEATRTALSEQFASYEFGNPAATANAILKVVDSSVPPLRLALGAGTLAQIATTYQERLATWESWKKVSVAAQR